MRFMVDIVGVTHQLTLIVNPFLTPQQVTANVGNDGVGVCNVPLNLGNDSTRLHDTIMDVGNGSRRASRQRR